MTDINNIQARKQAAVQFLQLVVAGQIDEAYRRYVDLSGKHHNPFFPAGFPALKKAMIENHVQFPNKSSPLRTCSAMATLWRCTPTSCCAQVRQA